MLTQRLPLTRLQHHSHHPGSEMRKTFALIAVVRVLGNLVIWGGLIYFTFWLLRHFGVI